MITLFGKMLRKLRIDKDVVLGEMAQSIGFSSAYLSSVENGKKKITDDLIYKVTEYFSLSNEKIEELKQAALDSPVSVKIDLSNSVDDERALVGAFARKIGDLSEDDKSDFWEILNR
ncbi:hypothetical protein GCM10009133_14600 [Cocleimonas flava]|uniref:Helix-turn-helix protein n=1 Tax=Cocleimonas flava TaxID=634765 RepID=A0A4R1F772_9GAMM|nr:helix-turn-helix transcriptional regulator [Cocleimonas flava]TCJ87828.1 helix-turn-helix protein [Cocleimonas flava]